MTYRRSWLSGGLLAATAVVLSAGCSGEPTGPDEGTVSQPPTIAAIPDQSVVRNTLTPRSVVIDLSIQDPDDPNVDVAVTSDDETVLGQTELTCGSAPCAVTLTPTATANAQVTVTVTATDDDGQQARTDFTLSVEPRLVTTTADDGAGSLRQAVASAEPGDVIGFDRAGVFGASATISLLGQIVVDRTLTIEGTGSTELTLSASDLGRGLSVSDGATVTVADLTVTDGVAPLEVLPPGAGPREARVGGGIIILPNSTLTLRRTRVMGNAATGSQSAGGGVANLGGTLLLDESEVTDNVAEIGGGILTRSTTERSSATTVIGGRVARNVASGPGGGITNVTGSLSVRGTRIDENSADGSGGGIFTNGRVDLAEGTEIVANEAGIAGGGLAVDATTVTITQTTVADNIATNNGGGLFMFGSRADVSASTVRGNQSVTRSGGGLFTSGGSLNLTDSELSTNRADGNGGGLHSRSRLDVTGSSITANIADSGGGGVWLEGDSDASIRATVVSGNRAAGNGGGVVVTASIERTTFDGVTIEDNEAMNDGGGVQYWVPNGVDGASVLEIVNDSRIANNRAVDEGGGIVQKSFGAATPMIRLNGSVVAGNSTSGAGGGVWIGAGSFAVMGAARVDNNSAGENGGGAFVEEGTLRLTTRGTVIANRASGNGGGVYVSGGVVSADGTFCMILANVADADGSGGGSGGGIFNQGGNIDGVPPARVCLNNPDDIVGR